MTPEKIGAAIVGALALIGGVAIMLMKLWSKLGFGKCPEECPDPNCQNFVQETRDNAAAAKENAAAAAVAVVKAEKSIIKLQEGQNHVREILEQKRIKIEGLQQDTTEIKTDVKWIVRELQKGNDFRRSGA